jgi:hypothetical protein
MDELYRMLGNEHECDLEREALTRRRAAEIGEQEGTDARLPRERSPRNRLRPILSRVAAVLWRPARAES